MTCATESSERPEKNLTHLYMNRGSYQPQFMRGENMERIEAAIASKVESCTCESASEHVARLREMSKLQRGEHVELVLKQVSDLNRFRLLKLLMKSSPLCVCEISAALQIEQTLASHHLRSLRSRGLVFAKRQGRWAHYKLADKNRVRSMIEAVEELSVLVFLNERDGE